MKKIIYTSLVVALSLLSTPATLPVQRTPLPGSGGGSPGYAMSITVRLAVPAGADSPIITPVIDGLPTNHYYLTVFKNSATDYAATIYFTTKGKKYAYTYEWP